MESSKIGNSDQTKEEGSADGNELQNNCPSSGTSNLKLPVKLVDYNSDSNSSWATEAHPIPDNISGKNKPISGDQQNNDKIIDGGKDMEENETEQAKSTIDNEMEQNTTATECKGDQKVQEKETSVVVQETPVMCDRVTDPAEKCNDDSQDCAEMKHDPSGGTMTNENEKTNEERSCVKMEPTETVEVETESMDTQSGSENIMEIKPMSTVTDENSKENTAETEKLTTIPAEVDNPENQTSLPVMCLVEVKQEKDGESGETEQTGDYH